ncbi:MAG: methyltransferase domain-containing protein [Agriterribacter sp.]
MRLILGAGKWTEKIDGDIFCDIRPFDRIDVVHDLNITPWPWNENSFTHISAIHLVEHLDSLLTFMDECWRILQPGCSLFIETPEAGEDPDLEFCDPTHVRCYRAYTWHNYFTPEGVEQFGYTNKPWCMLKQESKNGILYIHASTIK